MLTQYKYPTRKELENGVDIECKNSGDPCLEDLHATHVRLLLSDGFPLGFGDDESPEPDEEDEPLADAEPRSKQQAWDEFQELERQQRQVRPIDPAMVEPRLQIYVRLPGRRRWFELGVAGEWLETIWRWYDGLLLQEYILRLSKKRNLHGLLGTSEPRPIDEFDGPHPGNHPRLVTVVGEDTFQREVLECDIPVIVHFADRKYRPSRSVSGVLAEIAAERETALKTVKVDFDENEDLAERYGVEAVPMLMLFKAGKLVKKMEGFEGKKKLREWAG